MSEKETYYEMLWDCAQCNTMALLGDTHRHCPTCGAAQDPRKRYFPKVGEEIEAKNHQFVGADWACAYCATPNSAAAAHCTNCGAGQDGTKPVAIVVDAAAPASPVVAPVKDAPKSTWWRWALAVLALLMVVLGVLFSSTQEVTATVSGTTWQRTIQVEQFGPVSDSAWCDNVPADAYSVTQSREQRSTRRVEDGQECRDERIDQGDGTFVKRKTCTPRYREQPVYDNRCRFQVNRWRAYRSLKAGSESADEPVWPSLNALAPTSGRIGAERAGARQESYTLALQSQGKQWTCNVPETVWRKYEQGASVPLKIRKLGGADCGSLQ